MSRFVVLDPTTNIKHAANTEYARPTEYAAKTPMEMTIPCPPQIAGLIIGIGGEKMNQNLRKHHLPAAMKVYYSPEDLAFHISLRRRLHRDIEKLSFQTFSCVLQQQIDSLLEYGSAKFKHAITNAIKYKSVRRRQKIKQARVKTTKRSKKSMKLRSKKKQQAARSFSLDIESFPPLLSSQNIA